MASIISLLDDLATRSLPGPGVSRLSFTAEHKDAVEWVSEKMRQAGLKVHMDDAGTVVGRREGPEGAPTLLIGSHIDSVINGGRFDGAMGVVLPLVVLDGLKDTGLPYAVELLAFPDEEGVRFPTTLFGSRAMAGSFDMDILGYEDKDGTTLEKAMRDFGLEPGNIPGIDRRNQPLIGFIEIHLEQGPILQDEKLPVGVVTGIAGVDRYMVTINGQSNHAGTIPMEKRNDALVAASEMVIAVNRLAGESGGGKATVGTLDVTPNAVNVIPGKVFLTIDIRFDDDGKREKLCKAITGSLDEIADRRGVSVDCGKTYAQAATPCDDLLMKRLADASLEVQDRPFSISSGAFHDTSAMSDLCPVAMLFVRCHDGISHHPDEYVSEEDMQQAAKVLKSFLLNLKP